MNPVVRIGAQLEAVIGARCGLRGRPRLATSELLAAALALACQASLVVADEPTTALDVVAQAEVLQLVGAVTRAPQPAAVLLITHDLLAACAWADVVHVLDTGRVVESGAPADLLDRPCHPVTRAAGRAGAPRPVTASTAFGSSGSPEPRTTSHASTDPSVVKSTSKTPIPGPVRG